MRRDIAVGILAICMTSTSWAEDFSDLRYLPAARVAESMRTVELTKAYALGINRFDLDHHTSSTLELYLALAQEDPAGRPYYFGRVSRIYASQGNADEARRFLDLARRAELEKG